MGSNYTGQNRARCPSSVRVCEACVTVMAGKPPNTERMWTHLVEGSTHVRANKGQKPAIRDFLRRSHSEPWFAAIADSGQKHIIPWCTVNASDQPGGSVLFEEALVELPRDARGWSLIDEMTSLLTAGATKEEMATGAYGSRAWSLCSSELRSFEDRRGTLRGGGWFDLALWLAQRDEDKVAERMAAEKAATKAKKEAKSATRGTGKRAAANADGRGRDRAAERVPQDARMQRAETLGPDTGPNEVSSSVECESRGVADDDDANVAAGSVSVRQLSLLP